MKSARYCHACMLSRLDRWHLPGNGIYVPRSGLSARNRNGPRSSRVHRVSRRPKNRGGPASGAGPVFRATRRCRDIRPEGKYHMSEVARDRIALFGRINAHCGNQRGYLDGLPGGRDSLERTRATQNGAGGNLLRRSCLLPGLAYGKGQPTSNFTPWARGSVRP